MKKITTISIAIIALFVMYGCNKIKEVGFYGEAVPAGTRVSFKSNISAMKTKVSSDDFERGDAISIMAYYNDELYSSDTKYTFDGSEFSSFSPIIFDGSVPYLSYFAAYPTQKNFGKTFTFTAYADQSNIATFSNNDLLIAQQLNSRLEKPILNFEHAMSAIEINISANNEALYGGELTIYAQNKGVINLANQTIIAEGDVIAITPYSANSTSYKAMIAPQKFTSGSVVAKYVVGDSTFEWKAESDLELESGYSFTYDWEISENSDSI